MKNQKSTSFLFEIGVEEIPAGYFKGAANSILQKAPALLAECGCEAQNLQIFSTPRRIVVYAEEFLKLTANEEEKFGPLKNQAYDGNGKPTAALLGFLKSVNAPESAVYSKGSPKGERVCVKIKKGKKPLSYFFESLPGQIEFPKLMRWDKTRCTFTRPIRWTFAFIGAKPQKFKIGAAQSGTYTYGHRFLSSKKITVRNSDLKSYERLLAKHHVILDPQKRVQKIESFFTNENNKNLDLINTVAHLVEEPFPVRGKFDSRYLKLPTAVLKTCMSKNQKIFACYDKSGKLINQFLAVINGPRKSVKEISKNYESVLTSRLEDARFFFEDDQKTKLEAKVPKLKEMVFLGSLGSYFDKTKRLESLVRYLGPEAGLSKEIVDRASRAAYLAKADLVTHLVYEFPDLQGMAGFEYARLNGENDQTAKAISGHYLPLNLSEDYQALKKALNLEGALVGIADRVDLLVGAGGLGVELSGSQDPYALRRAAGGIVKILRAHPMKISLSKLINEARNLYGNKISRSKEELSNQLIPFFKDRLIFELQLKAGSREFELLKAIMATQFDWLVEIYEKFDRLKTHVNEEAFEKACKVMERTGNILKGIKDKVSEQIDPNSFESPLERHLFDLLVEEENTMKQMVHDKNYDSALKRYASVFYGPVHEFFDQVLVNAENPKIRMNRQALVGKINQLCRKNLADLSLIHIG